MSRPMPSLLILAALAGCAAPAGTGNGQAGAGQLSPSVAAVRAFAQLCGSLQGKAVAGRAQSFAFIPMDSIREGGVALPAELRAEGVRAWIRPVKGAPALLTWSEASRTCELGVGGVEPAEVEREFGALAAGLERSGLAVTRVSQFPQAPAGQLPLRQAMVVSPRALTPGQPRAFMLRVNPNPAESLQVVMATRPVSLSARAQPAQPDDAVPVE